MNRWHCLKTNKLLLFGCLVKLVEIVRIYLNVCFILVDMDHPDCGQIESGI